MGASNPPRAMPVAQTSTPATHSNLDINTEVIRLDQGMHSQEGISTEDLTMMALRKGIQLMVHRAPDSVEAAGGDNQAE